jgi:hypothetical protein
MFIYLSLYILQYYIKYIYFLKDKYNNILFTIYNVHLILKIE